MKRLEAHWQIPVPKSFAALYAAKDGAQIGAAEFYPMRGLLSDEGREPGMLPQVLPFADTEAGEIAGFYVRTLEPAHAHPILLWDREEDYYIPIAHSFDAFLGWCLVEGRYRLGDEVEDAGEAETKWMDALRRLGLDADLLSGPPPRNERERMELLMREPIGSAYAMLELGASRMAAGDLNAAAALFDGAVSAVSWFGDAHFLRAEAWRRAGNEGAAVAEWLRTLGCLQCLATHTGLYDLGPDAPEEYIYVQAAKELHVRQGSMPLEDAEDPTWRLARHFDLLEDAQFHLELASFYSRQGRTEYAERELLNALTMGDGATLQDAYDGIIALYRACGRTWDEERCRRDRELLGRCSNTRKWGGGAE